MAKKIITVQVTKQDIKNGMPKEGDKCPIAKAVRRCTGTHRAVFVDESSIEIGAVEYSLPASAKAFVRAFDKGKPVSPFSMKLVPPCDI